VPSSNKETDIDTNRSKRFDFLLKQTEIFSHFMPGSSKITPEKKKKPGRKKEVEVEPEPEAEIDGVLDPNADPAE
jgi:DNA-binding domain